MRQSRRVRLCVAMFASAALLLAGCARDAPSTLDPAGYGARRVAGLWWLLFWISVGVFVVVLALLGWACCGGAVRGPGCGRGKPSGSWWSPVSSCRSSSSAGVRDLAGRHVRARQRVPRVHDDRRGDRARVVVGGRGTRADRRGDRQRDPHSGAGEGPGPATTADVLHSFWVPQLMPKTDLIAGRDQRRPGCARTSPAATGGSAPSTADCSTRTWPSWWSPSRGRTSTAWLDRLAAPATAAAAPPPNSAG